LKKCQICDQKADFYTSVHRKEPFADGRLYECVCFTCFLVPKTSEQKYTKEGLISEDIELPYSCENMHSAKELYESGASDSIRQAKICVEAVEKLRSKSLKPKTARKRPKASWNIY
jgi:hypothetical protein